MWPFRKPAGPTVADLTPKAEHLVRKYASYCPYKLVEAPDQIAQDDRVLHQVIRTVACILVDQVLGLRGHVGDGGAGGLGEGPHGRGS